MSRSGAPQARGAEQLLVIVVDGPRGLRRRHGLLGLGLARAARAPRCLRRESVSRRSGSWPVTTTGTWASLAPTHAHHPGRAARAGSSHRGWSATAPSAGSACPAASRSSPPSWPRWRSACSQPPRSLRRRQPPRDWREAMRPVGAAAAILCGLIVISDLGSAIAVGLAAAAVLIASGAAAGALARLGYGGSGARGRDDRRRAVPHPAADRVPAPGRHARRGRLPAA